MVVQNLLRLSVIVVLARADFASESIFALFFRDLFEEDGTMNMKMVWSVAGALCVGMAALATAQTVGQNNQPQQTGQSFPAEQGQAYTDAQIAAVLNVGNQEELAISRLAEQKASNQDVKDIARDMVKAHSQLWQQLNQVAAAGGLGTQTAEEQRPAQTQQTQRQTQQARQQQTMAGGGLNFVAIAEQMGQECTKSLTREFQDKQGAHFDKAYVGWSIGAHMQMMGKLKVLRNYASPQLQTLLAQAEQETQSHLDHFKKLMHSLESNSNRTP